MSDGKRNGDHARVGSLARTTSADGEPSGDEEEDMLANLPGEMPLHQRGGSDLGARKASYYSE